MNDSISRKTVLSILHNKAFDSVRNDEKYNLLRWCMKQIESLPTVQPQTGWIPCSSGKMPPIDKDVLITYTYPNGLGVRDLAHLGKDGEWYNKNFGLRLSSDRITAWMPLPQPYKENE